MISAYAKHVFKPQWAAVHFSLKGKAAFHRNTLFYVDTIILWFECIWLYSHFVNFQLWFSFPPFFLSSKDMSWWILSLSFNLTIVIFFTGIDVEMVSVVVNFDLPVTVNWSPDCETYLHRIGRTGRFGKQGFAINMVDGPQSMSILKAIEKHFGELGKKKMQWNAPETNFGWGPLESLFLTSFFTLKYELSRSVMCTVWILEMSWVLLVFLLLFLLFFWGGEVAVILMDYPLGESEALDPD